MNQNASARTKTPSCTGFMVNNSHIGSSANQIGMTQSSWHTCFQCGQPLGSCTAVQGSSPYDQFSSFRSSSLASVLTSAGSNCSWLGNSAMSNGSVQYPVQLVACDYPSSQLSVTLRLSATAYGVVPTLPVLSLVNGGQFTWLPGSLTGQFCTAMWYCPAMWFCPAVWFCPAMWFCPADEAVPVQGSLSPLCNRTTLLN